MRRGHLIAIVIRVHARQIILDQTRLMHQLNRDRNGNKVSLHTSRGTTGGDPCGQTEERSEPLAVSAGVFRDASERRGELVELRLAPFLERPQPQGVRDHLVTSLSVLDGCNSLMELRRGTQRLELTRPPSASRAPGLPPPTRSILSCSHVRTSPRLVGVLHATATARSIFRTSRTTYRSDAHGREPGRHSRAVEAAYSCSWLARHGVIPGGAGDNRSFSAPPHRRTVLLGCACSDASRRRLLH